MKILVSCPFPFSGMKSIACERSLAAIDGYHYGAMEFHRKDVRGSNVPRARNAIVEYAIVNNYDWLLNVDSDISFTPEQAVLLLKNNADFSIIGGAYTLRDTKEYFCGGFWYQKHVGVSPMDLRIKSDIRVPKIVDWVGTGFLALNLRVLCQIIPGNIPWFRYEIVTLPGGGEDMTSEDIGFAILASKYTVPIIIDCRVVVDHHPFILPPAIPEVDLSDWTQLYAERVDQLRDLGKTIAKQFQHYAKSMGG